ncbi:MAG TPA: GFA family protein [Kofleriaceae bacterium]|jgi:hypothetical protein
MSEMQTYNGSCHCGAVKYTIQSAPIEGAMACNCSMCRRAGTLLTFVPEAQFALDAGADSLASYKFNKHNIDHVFCKSCGIKSFAHGKGRDGAKMVAINVRCLDGVDLDKLAIKHVDGASA